MSRKLAAIAAMVILVALALTLLWRVYVHHDRRDPEAGQGVDVVSRSLEEAPIRPLLA